jgi:hypothetical protein
LSKSVKLIRNILLNYINRKILSSERIYIFHIFRPQSPQRNFADIIINTDFPNLTQNNAKFANLIYIQINFFMSQLHQHEKLGPGRINN